MTLTSDSEKQSGVESTLPTSSKKRGRPPKKDEPPQRERRNLLKITMPDFPGDLVDMPYGESQHEKGTLFEFLYSCGECGMKIKTVDVAYVQKVCGKCNRKLTVHKQER